LKNKSRPEAAAKEAATWVISERELRERLKREKEEKERKERLEVCFVSLGLHFSSLLIVSGWVFDRRTADAESCLSVSARNKSARSGGCARRKRTAKGIASANAGGMRAADVSVSATPSLLRLRLLFWRPRLARSRSRKTPG